MSFHVNKKDTHSLHRHCGGHNHANLTRPCRNNDTDCGFWVDKWWHPYGCSYRHVTSENARKCVGNRTLACIGDSQIRDICQAVVDLLLGKYDTKDTLRTGKFDYHHMDDDGTIIDDVSWWEKNVPPHNHNGYIYPKPFNNTYKEHHWQLQMWSLFRLEFIHKQAKDVMFNKMINKTQDIRPIDFLMFNFGLHDWGYFYQKPDRGLHYYDMIKGQYMEVRIEIQIPNIWISMNTNCAQKLSSDIRKMDQHGMVEDANKYINQRFLDGKIPYFDADAVLRTNHSCMHSDDGVHVHMYVDMMRAKMLFNHLCDSNWNWKQNEMNYFI